MTPNADTGAMRLPQMVQQTLHSYMLSMYAQYLIRLKNPDLNG